MKLGSRGKYQPMQYCWVYTSRLLGYLVHTCHLPIDIQQIYCSTQTGQHSRLLDISRQLACMKLGTRGKYQPMQYCKSVARLPSSYMPFAYRYPTNILQYPDRTAFALVGYL